MQYPLFSQQTRSLRAFQFKEFPVDLTEDQKRSTGKKRTKHVRIFKIVCLF